MAVAVAVAVAVRSDNGAMPGRRGGGSGNAVVAYGVRWGGVAGAGDHGDQVPVRGDPVQRRRHGRLLHPLRGAPHTPQGLRQGNKQCEMD